MTIVTAASLRGYNWETMTDASLVRAVLAGDTAAFTSLVDRHARICLRFATRMLGNVQDAEDVTQDTFIRAYGALARYDETLTFQTWLMAILVNRCRTALSNRRRRDARVVVDDAVVLMTPSANVDDPMLREAITRALERLETKQREAFLLKHVEELSYEEMAAITGVGISALKMRVRRACERLQILLEDDRYD